MTTEKILSVTDITRQIKGVLELGFSNILVQGEISNCKIHSSGHMYFTLKDDQAQISGVMWRSRVQQMKFRPSDGMKVIARGNVSVYEPRGNYQLDCLQLQPLGVGELQRAYDQLKKKLFDEGLFDENRKRPLPLYPSRVGIVTSPTGAAVRDMISVFSRRMPMLELILVPVKVQGIGAAEEIVDAIQLLNESQLVDLIIVGRGGGSLEDLWAFNEEKVARAIFGSETPVVSAVGHEIDFTISDFVADLRAPTPSAAAELVVRDKSELIELIRNFCYTMSNSMLSMVETQRQFIGHLIQSYSFNKPQDLVKQRSQRLDDLVRRLEKSFRHNVQLNSLVLKEYTNRLQGLDPMLVLKRGYTIVRQEGKIVSRAHQVNEESSSQISFYDGSVTATFHSQSKSDNGKKRK